MKYFYSNSFKFFFLFDSCELSQRFLTKFEKLADAINARDDIQLAHVNCDQEKQFCESKTDKGKENENPFDCKNV